MPRQVNASAGRGQHADPSDVPPSALRVLVDRFDPAVFDLTGGSAVIRLAVRDGLEWDAQVDAAGITLRPAEDADPADGPSYDARLSADSETWQGIATDLAGGMEAYRRGSLAVRRNLHVGVGFLAATSAIVDSSRLRFVSVKTAAGRLSTLSAGEGEPVVCLHGLGATKVSFLSTVAALSDRWRVTSVDLPGFGDSDKPLFAPYDAAYFARAVTALLDAQGIDRAHLIGNSMGGRVAIEVGLRYPERVDRIALLSPALAWLRERKWLWLLKAPLPKLGLIQPAPRAITDAIVRGLIPGGRDGWSAAGVDEFLRSYLTPRGRVAFYESARNIYLDEPRGEEGLFTRLSALPPPSLFIWGLRDKVVPVGFRRHVEAALPSARHLELNCGHVPQYEAPEATHQAIRDFFSEA